MAAGKLTRRELLKGAAAASAFSIIPASARGADGPPAPADRVTLGMIGVGSHGAGYNMPNFFNQPDVQIVAVCDVDGARARQAQQKVDAHYAQATRAGAYKGCAAYRDFRELIARDDIDAVMISTPDHWHVPCAIEAARAGKDVICEKPLTLFVQEGRALSDTVRRYGTVFQTSSENRSIGVYHHMCELVRNGRIGRLRRIIVGLPPGWTGNATLEEKKPSTPPADFDYDFWLGQAPDAPYCKARCHYTFRWISDYSGGHLTDWGAHLIDIAQWGNDTEHTGPVDVEGRGLWTPDPLYDTATAFEVDCLYANGVRLEIRSTGPSIRFEGSEGWIASMGWRGALTADPVSLLNERIGPEETHLYTCPGGEHRNFLDCVKTRRECYAPAEVGHRTVTIAHLGNISMSLRRKLRWDPEHEQVVGDATANRMLSRAMRAPWRL